MFVWWFTEAILLALDQPPEIAALAGEYARWHIIGLLPIAWFE